jgi:hypothetical protein
MHRVFSSVLMTTTMLEQFRLADFSRILVNVARSQADLQIGMAFLLDYRSTVQTQSLRS